VLNTNWTADAEDFELNEWRAYKALKNRTVDAVKCFLGIH